MALATRLKGKHKKESSKDKCFNYGEFGHYSTKCLRKKHKDEKKKGKQVVGVATSIEIDDLFRILESEGFSLISHFSHGNIDEAAWYVDSGVSKNMTGSQGMFETLS